MKYLTFTLAIPLVAACTAITVGPDTTGKNSDVEITAQELLPSGYTHQLFIQTRPTKHKKKGARLFSVARFVDGGLEVLPCNITLAKTTFPLASVDAVISAEDTLTASVPTVVPLTDNTETSLVTARTDWWLGDHQGTAKTTEGPAGTLDCSNTKVKRIDLSLDGTGWLFWISSQLEYVFALNMELNLTRSSVGEKWEYKRQLEENATDTEADYLKITPFVCKEDTDKVHPGVKNELPKVNTIYAAYMEAVSNASCARVQDWSQTMIKDAYPQDGQVPLPWNKPIE